jgi:hypothetical protein
MTPIPGSGRAKPTPLTPVVMRRVQAATWQEAETAAATSAAAASTAAPCLSCPWSTYPLGSRPTSQKGQRILLDRNPQRLLRNEEQQEQRTLLGRSPALEEKGSRTTTAASTTAPAAAAARPKGTVRSVATRAVRTVSTQPKGTVRAVATRAVRTVSTQPKDTVRSVAKRAVRTVRTQKPKKTQNLQSLQTIYPSGVNSVVQDDGWEEIELAVDSGATETVVGEEMLGSIKTTEGEAFKRGVEYEVANGVTIPNLGEKCFVAVAEQGQRRKHRSVP